MKKLLQSTLLALSVLFFLNPILSAQTQIIGTIADKSGKALPFANVLLLNAKDSAFIKGTIAKDDGSFAIEHVAVGRMSTLVSKRK